MKKIALTDKTEFDLIGKTLEASKAGFVVDGERRKVMDLESGEAFWMVHMKLKPTKNPTRTAG